MILQPENANKRIDNLGRITLPKGLRARLYLDTGTEMELYTMTAGGRQYVCMTKAANIDPRYYVVKEVLEELNVEVPEEVLKVLDNDL